MGWSEGYDILENTIIAAYDEGVLTKRLLERIMEPFKEKDLDRDGEKRLAKNGLRFGEIVTMIMMPEEYKKALKSNEWYEGHPPKDRSDWIFENKELNTLYDRLWYDEWGMF